MNEVTQVGKMSDLIVRDVQNVEAGVAIETRYLGQGVMRDVELFQVGEIREARDSGKAIRLYRQDFEIIEM